VNAVKVKLDIVGDFVVFPSRFFHRGYYTIASNMTYYTAQLFCKISDNPEAWQNVTRKVNQITMQGRVEESWLAQLTQDIKYIYNRGRIMYKEGGNQKKGAKFGTFLKILYIKKNDYI